MSLYRLFIVLHALDGVLVWLVPLLIAILLCGTALLITARRFRARREQTGPVSELVRRIEALESRIDSLESLGGTATADASVDHADAEH